MSSIKLFISILFVSLISNPISADEPQYRSYYYFDSYLNISKGDSKLLRRPIHQISPFAVNHLRRIITTSIDGILNHRSSNLCNNISTPLLPQASPIVLFIPLYVPTQVFVDAFLVFYSFNFYY